MSGYDPSFDPFSPHDPFRPEAPSPPKPPPGPRSPAPRSPAPRGWAPELPRSSFEEPSVWDSSSESTGPIPALTFEPPEIKATARVSPATVFLGSYAFVGIAAVLLAAATALGLALSDFRHQHTSPTLILAFIAASLVMAVAVLWLSVLDGRGHTWARKATWGVCAAATCAAAAVFVFDPGTSVAWFGELLRFGAVVLMVVAVVASLLLGLPQSNAFFRPPPGPEPVAVAAPSVSSPPAASYTPAPWMPIDEPDPDPFS